MAYTQRIYVMYIIVFPLNFLTVKELSIERQFTVWAAKINHSVYYKGILISKFEFKFMLEKRFFLCFHRK